MPEQRAELSETQAVFGVLLISLVAYSFHAFGTGVVADNWRLIPDPWGEFHVWFLRIRRWGVLPLWAATQWGTVAPAVTLTACVGLLMLGVRRIAPLVGLDTPLSRGAAALVLILSPTTGAHLAYKQNHLPLGLGFLLAVEAIRALHVSWEVPRSRSTAGWLLLSFAALVWAIGLHHVSALVFVTLVVFVLLHGLGSPTAALTVRVAASGAALLLAAFACSQTIGSRLLAWFELDPLAPDHKYASHYVASLEELTSTTERTAALVWEFLFQAQHLIPLPVKVSILVLLVWMVAARAFSVRGALERVFALSCAPVLASLPFVVAWVRVPENSYRYTALFTVSVVYGMVCGTVLARAAGRARWAASALVGVVVVQLALSANASGWTMQMNTQLDLRMASSILQMVDERAGGRPVETIRLLGLHHRDEPPWRLPGGSGRMNTSVTQFSVFNERTFHVPAMFQHAVPRSASVSQIRVIEQSSGWRGPLRAALKNKAVQKQARRAKRWPDPRSVIWVPETSRAYVVISKWAEQDLRQLAKQQDAKR